jgi:ornithine--oxo-acid transaminase
MVFYFVCAVIYATVKRMSHYIEQENRYTAHNYQPLPVVIAKGEGAHLWDERGRRYIDMMSAYSAVSHGHCNPRLVKVMHKQAQKLTVTSRAFYNSYLGSFAKLCCDVSGMERILPMNTGAEAVETAIKAARLWGYRSKKIPHGKAEIIVAANNFHGRTTTIVSFSSEDVYKHDFAPLTPGFKEVPFGDANALERAITENTCAFLVEPMQGEAGIILPPKGWLKKVQEICRKHNVLLIVDEIQTGLCRTGKMFAFQHEIDAPDGLIVGKALGGGLLPVSAFLAKAEVMDLFTPGSHGSTFGGNPLACVVAEEALRIMLEDKYAEKAKKLGDYMMAELNAIESPLITDVRGKGLWVGVEFDPDKIHARVVCEKLLEKGVLTKDTHETVVRLAPPLMISKDLLDQALTCFRQAVSELET